MLTRLIARNFVTFVTILLMVSSCYYNNEESLYPTVACDTVNVTFNPVIRSMISNNCLTCHSSTTSVTSGSNINLEPYANVKLFATAIDGAIKHLPSHSPMPKNGGMLSKCLIDQFDIWIRTGFPEN